MKYEHLATIWAVGMALALVCLLKAEDSPTFVERDPHPISPISLPRLGVVTPTGTDTNPVPYSSTITTPERRRQVSPAAAIPLPVATVPIHPPGTNAPLPVTHHLKGIYPPDVSGLTLFDVWASTNRFQTHWVIVTNQPFGTMSDKYWPANPFEEYRWIRHP